MLARQLSFWRTASGIFVRTAVVPRQNRRVLLDLESKAPE